MAAYTDRSLCDQAPSLALWQCAEPAISPEDFQPQPRQQARTTHPLTRRLPARLAQKLLASYSAPGELVVEVAPPHRPAIRGVIATQAAELGRRCLQYDPPTFSPFASRQQRPDPWAGLHNAVDLLVVVLPGAAPVGRPPRRRDPIVARGILAAWAQTAPRLLAPGGRLVVVTNAHRYRGEHIDLPGETVRLAQHAGLGYLQHVIALLDDVHTTPPAPGWRRAQPVRIRGVMVHAPVHADVLAFTTPASDTGMGVVRR